MSGNGNNNNYNSTPARARVEIEIDPNDDPVEIAVRAFSGSPINRRLWRWYYNMMVYLEKGDSDKAAEIFTTWCYEMLREITVDALPNKENLHARCFHKRLKERFQLKYGAVKCPWHKKGVKR